MGRTDRSHEIANLRFTVEELADGRRLMRVARISDGLSVSPQVWLDVDPTDDELAEIAERWILARAGNFAPEPKTCTRCATPLHSATGADTDTQFAGALALRFTGGYGMFIDPHGGEPNPTAILCRDCATQLCADQPWLAELLDPHRTP